MTPPSYNPEHERSFSFEQYCRQVQLWTLMSDLQPYQQCAALLQQLRGSAAELGQAMQTHEMLHGGVVNGIHVDPVTLLFHALQQRYAPMAEETRLVALSNVMTFRRRPVSYTHLTLPTKA